MPLLEIRQLSPAISMGLWHITEEADSPRQKERQAVQNLLIAMTNNPRLTIGHESSGKPFLVDSQQDMLSSERRDISISHTRGYAVILLSSAGRVGIDVEWRSDRVERIAHRFLRLDEQAATTDEKLLIWSAKETLYKLFSEDNLLFNDMRTLTIGERTLHIENMKRRVTVDVGYEFTADYVLTYAELPA